MTRDWTGTNPGYALDSTEPPKPPPPGPASGTRIHAEDAPNPPDCVCRYKHCSDPQCQSAAPSQGAVRERDRAFPASPDVTDAEILAALTAAAEGTGTYLDDYTFDGDVEIIVKAFHALLKERR
jgi:hypothetical protein